jgi:hypothetical protein
VHPQQVPRLRAHEVRLAVATGTASIGPLEDQHRWVTYPAATHGEGAGTSHRSALLGFQQ